MVAVPSASKLPSLYTSHIAIERTAAGSYHIEARSSRSGIRQPSYPQFEILEDAISAARQWASAEGIPIIHVFAPAEEGS